MTLFQSDSEVAISADSHCFPGMDHSRLESALMTIVMPSTPPGAGVGEAIQMLDAIVRENRDNLDPNLLHYLERRSYQKALTYLRNPTATPGHLA